MLWHLPHGEKDEAVAKVIFGLTKCQLNSNSPKYFNTKLGPCQKVDNIILLIFCFVGSVIFSYLLRICHVVLILLVVVVVFDGAAKF